MMLLPPIFCALAIFSTEIHLTPDQQSAVLREAQLSYDHGVQLQTADPVASMQSFRRSANRFQLLVDDGIENGKLWYDLGNAQLQSGEVGEAIAAYRSAQRYIPSDGRVQTNLKHARSLITNPIAGKDTSSLFERLAFWHESLPTPIRFGLGLTLWLSCWTLISIRLFTQIPGFKTALATLGIVAIALGISVGADIANQHQDHGVLTAQEVIVRKGNGTQYAPMFQEPIHEGIEFDILGRRSNWLHIRLPNGAEGWIDKKDAQIVSLHAKEPVT